MSARRQAYQNDLAERDHKSSSGALDRGPKILIKEKDEDADLVSGSAVARWADSHTAYNVYVRGSHEHHECVVYFCACLHLSFLS